jgi:putative transposase
MGGRSSIVKNRRHTPEQIIRKLREADRMLGEGQDLASVTKELEVSEATYHRWRARFGGMTADDARRLRELERENAKLKRIVADQLLDIEGLKELARGNF